MVVPGRCAHILALLAYGDHRVGQKDLGMHDQAKDLEGGSPGNIWAGLQHREKVKCQEGKVEAEP